MCHIQAIRMDALSRIPLFPGSTRKEGVTGEGCGIGSAAGVAICSLNSPAAKRKIVDKISLRTFNSLTVDTLIPNHHNFILHRDYVFQRQ